jgi:hypothetical protein
MKYFIPLFALILVSCNGKLTDEQKRKIREEREESQIKKINEADITEAAFHYGRTITDIIDKRDKLMSNKAFLDSLENAYGVEIISMQKHDPTLRAVEKKVMEAYVSEGSIIALNDNVQKMGKDSILYTKPLMRELPNGSVTFTSAMGLRIPKKQIIRTIK